MWYERDTNRINKVIIKRGTHKGLFTFILLKKSKSNKETTRNVSVGARMARYL